VRLRFAIPALALGGLCAAAPTAEAQRVTSQGYSTVDVQTASRGQLGVHGNLAITQEGRALRTVIVITGTAPNSPARRAGLQRGDSIIAVGGQRLTVESWAEFRGGLHADDEVRLTLLRNGEQREVLLQAEPAEPATYAFTTNWSAGSVALPEDVQVDVASIQDRVVRAFEEARLRIEEEPKLWVTRLKADSTMTATIELVREARREGFAYTVQTDDEGRTWVVSAQPPEEAVEPREPVAALMPRPRVRSGVSLSDDGAPTSLRTERLLFLRPDSTRQVIHLNPTIPLPANVMRLGGETADSLTGEWVRLRSQLAQLERGRVERERQIMEEARRRAETLRATDEELAELEETNREIYERMAALEERLRAAGERNNRVVVRPPEAVVAEAAAEESAGLLSRFNRERERDRRDAPPTGTVSLSARVVGEHFVMGAQVRSLTPKLAEYFEAERGVLVVEVLDGAPAARAGIVPGDVIVRAGRHEIRDVDGLRRALNEGRSGLRFRVVRKGEELTLILPN